MALRSRALLAAALGRPSQQIARSSIFREVTAAKWRRPLEPSEARAAQIRGRPAPARRWGIRNAF